MLHPPDTELELDTDFNPEPDEHHLYGLPPQSLEEAPSPEQVWPDQDLGNEADGVNADGRDQTHSSPIENKSSPERAAPVQYELTSPYSALGIFVPKQSIIVNPTTPVALLHPILLTTPPDNTPPTPPRSLNLTMREVITYESRPRPPLRRKRELPLPLDIDNSFPDPEWLPTPTVTSAYDQGKLLFLAEEAGPQTRTSARGVFVSESTSRTGIGKTIMRAPLAYAVLETDFLKSHCSGCFLTAAERAKKVNRPEHVVRKEFLKCKRCCAVVYCSVVSLFPCLESGTYKQRCYVKSAMDHFAECRASKHHGSIPPTETRLLARVFFARAAGRVSQYWWVWLTGGSRCAKLRW